MRSARSTGARRRNRVLAALVASGAAACAALDSELAAARESWRGATYDQVVAAWGPPTRKAGDSYAWSSEDRLPQAQRSGSGAGGVIFGAAPDAVAARCERTLVIHDARVVRAGDWKGEPQFCKRFARAPR
jgi:hypothetical protein